MIAAQRLWKVAPEAARRLLDASSEERTPASLMSLIVSAPDESTGPVARAILSQRDLLAGAGEVTQSESILRIGIDQYERK